MDKGVIDEQRLREISGELKRIAEVLLPPPSEAGPSDGPVDPAYVRSVIGTRRLRDKFFKSEIFADPAWDMLLDLYAARLEGRDVSVASLCIASAVPPTTALRWIKMLSDQGLFLKAADPDSRRVRIELSDHAAKGMEGYMRAARRREAMLG